jgi:hypothetical protein
MRQIPQCSFGGYFRPSTADARAVLIGYMTEAGQEDFEGNHEDG